MNLENQSCIQVMESALMSMVNQPGENLDELNVQHLNRAQARALGRMALTIPPSFFAEHLEDIMKIYQLEGQSRNILKPLGGLKNSLKNQLIETGSIKGDKDTQDFLAYMAILSISELANPNKKNDITNEKSRAAQTKKTGCEQYN